LAFFLLTGHNKTIRYKTRLHYAVSQFVANDL
jgi:hypothetical protein